MAGSEETAAGGVKHERISVVGGTECRLVKVLLVSFSNCFGTRPTTLGLIPYFSHRSICIVLCALDGC